jgi:hypothetical protein
MSEMRNYVVQAAQDALQELMAETDWRTRISAAVGRIGFIQCSPYYREGMPIEVLTAVDRVVAAFDDPDAWTHEGDLRYARICNNLNSCIEAIFTADGAGSFSHGRS